MKKIYFVLTFCICACFSVQAHSVDPETALSVARHFYANLDRMNSQVANPVLVYQSTFTKVENVGGRSVEQLVPGFYVANFGDEGFVIVAADDRVNPILAFFYGRGFRV